MDDDDDVDDDLLSSKMSIESNEEKKTQAHSGEDAILLTAGSPNNETGISLRQFKSAGGSIVSQGAP